MVLIPPIPAIPLLFLQVVTDHQGCSRAFIHRANHLFVWCWLGGRHSRRTLPPC